MQKPLPKQFQSETYQYQLLKFIGQGSGGEVYLADQKHLQNNTSIKVAIKRKLILVNEDETILTKELIKNRTKYPNLVQYFDFFELKTYGQMLVMEYMESGNLYDYICDRSNRKKQNFVKEAQQIIYQVSLGIQQLHSDGLMHRDLKPENVLIQLKHDNTYIIKICDMDLVKKVKQENLFNTQCVGTAYYIAPEVLALSNMEGQGIYDLKCDVWSLGAMIYEIFSEETLFQGNEHQIQEAILKFDNNKQQYYDLIDKLKDLDQGYKNIIKQMLTYNYNLRPSIDDVIGEIAKYGKNHLLASIDEGKYLSRRIVNNNQFYYCLDSQQTMSGINGFRVYLGRKDDHETGQQILLYVFSELDDKGINQLKQMLDLRDKLKYVVPIYDVFQNEGDYVIVQLIEHAEELATMDQIRFNGIAKQEQIKNLIYCLQELQDYKLVVGDFKLQYMVKYSSEKFKLDVMKSDNFLKEKMISRNDPDKRFYSPEQLQNNKPNLKSDIWTMGVLIYEIVCGKHLDTSNLNQHHIDEQINKVDLEYKAYLLQMLKLNPDQRSVPTLQSKSLFITGNNNLNSIKAQGFASQYKSQTKEEISQQEIVKVQKKYDDLHKLQNLFWQSS
ncbi:hypothetical protein pb186bvf_013184 [Paramecium bursaria]